MQAGWCVVCGSAAADPFPAVGAAGFVLCVHCGHVYRDGHPASQESSPPEADLLRGCRLSEWAAARTEATVRRLTALHIGPEAGAWRLPLLERGWEVVSADLAPLRRIERLGPRAFHGRTFSLILLSDAIEALPDPVPWLRRLHLHLQADGALCIGTRNLLAPGPCGVPAEPPPACLRLYSRGALEVVLARAGFRAEPEAYYEGGSLGLLARAEERVPEPPWDDPAAIRQLYGAQGALATLGPLGWNLAALAESQPWTLPLLCRRPEPGRYAVLQGAVGPVAVVAPRDDGADVAIVRWGELDGLGTPPPAFSSRAPRTLVQLGLGSGEQAAALAERLHPAQHLFVWEADPSLARAVLEATDLSHLWLSAQVSLLLGEFPDLPAERARRLLDPALVYPTASARMWNTWIYRTVLGTLTPAAIPAPGRLRLREEPAAAADRLRLLTAASGRLRRGDGPGLGGVADRGPARRSPAPRDGSRAACRSRESRA